MLHWSFVIIFIYGVIKQVNDISQLEDESLLVFEIVFAFLFVTLLGIRFVYMKNTQTSLPSESPEWQKKAARIVHLGMYLSLAIIAISGLIIGGLFWQGKSEGLLIDSIVVLHELSVSSSYALISVHIIAALYHKILKDGVWSAMVPMSKD
ncbi:cytochrome B [Veronia pacifica]|uniref:Cytochrome B n=1 Tax=Veronia pacifica TaxID=1080227 RepID=A0A1C3EBS2_9GAMM|nr:cytochrome B [Veronia pacifica]